MGGALRDRWTAVVRPLFFAVLVAVAWLAWMAGPAHAASDDPNPLGSLGQPAVTLLQETSSAAAAVTDLSAGARAPAAPTPAPAPAPAPTPAIQGVPVPVVAVPFPVSGPAATVVDVADPVLSDTSDLVTTLVNRAPPVVTDVDNTLPTGPVTETVTQTVTGTVDAVVSVADSIAPALPSVPLPTVPLPTSPLPTVQLPTLPLPSVSLPPVSLPTWPGHLPRPTGHVPGVAEPISVSSAEPGALARTGVDASAESASSETARDASTAGRALRFSVSPLEFLANTHALNSLASAIGYAVSRASASPTPPDTDEVLRFAAVHGQSGSASAGTGSGEGAADVAGPWDPLHDALGALMPDASRFPSAGPSFDPGSSPD